MKKVVLLTVLLLLPQLSIAADSDSPLYFGIKYGSMSPDWAGINSGGSIGIDAGYKLGDLFKLAEYATFAVEAAYTTTISKGDAYGGKWDLSTLALYAVARSNGEFYGKLKGGFIYEDASVSLPGFSASGTDSGRSGGIGVGWRFSQAGMLELELTGVEKKMDYLSVAYYRHF